MTIDAARTALLVMDYQVAIVGSVDGADALVERTVRGVGVARDRGVVVGFVRVAFDDADYERIPPNNKSFSTLAAERRFPADAPESAIHPSLTPLRGDIVVRKTRVGAFSTTDLDRQLREQGIDTLVLAGIATSGVVLSTVRDAADRDYRLYVLEDACADRDPEVHDVLMGKVLPRQADVISTSDLADLLSG
jgi:nicotinamidase-related amidase